MPTLYILCGFPYSGKSLLSKEIEKTTSIKRVSFDDIYDNLTKSNKDTTYEVGLKEVRDELIKNLKAGNSIVYDSTNLTSESRNNLKKLAENAGAQAKVVYLETPTVEIYRRRAQSIIDKSHRNTLTEKDMENAVGRLEAPTDCILISTSKEKENFLKSLR